MAVSYVASAWGTSGTATVTIAVPTGTADNDVMVAIVQRGGGVSEPDVPTGWTSIDYESTGPSTRKYWKVASSEPASYDFTSSGINIAGVISTYRGVDTTSPINANVYWNRLTGGSNITANTLTPSVDNCMIVFLGGVGGSTGTVTKPTGWNAREEQVGNQVICVADLLQTTAAATGSVTATTSLTANTQAAMVALTPAAVTSAIKTIDSLAKASIKTINGLAIASVKTRDGLA